MHTSAHHRAHIIAAAAPEHEPAHTATPEMRRIAALFNAYRDAALQGAAPPADATPTQDPAPAHEYERPKEDESELAGSADNSEPAGLFGVRSQAGLTTLPEPIVQKERGNTGEGRKDSENREGNDPPPSAPSGPPQTTQLAKPAHGRVEAAAAAQAIGGSPGATQPNPLLDSVVSSVAEFCANPAVFSSSPWRISVPLDRALLPGCALSLTLSDFDLTLRFSTNDTASQQLILKHADTLRERLESLPSLQQDTPLRIAIIVTQAPQ
jgi:type III secretion control protein HpaP